MGVAFFDLDRTLIDCNSGRLWLQQELREGRVSVRQAVWASYWLLRYALGHSAALDQAFADAVATLKDVEEAEIDARTRAWFEAHVRHRLRPGAERALRVHREAGDRLVLATSSSRYAAAAALEAYALHEAIASTFEVLDGRFTGRVAASAFGAAKADRVAEWAQAQGVRLADCTFYTDSITDLALLERVGRPVAVNPDRVLQRIARERGWACEDWGACR